MSHVLVIGAAGGVGAAVVQALIARGDTVTGTVLNDQEEAAARQSAPALRDLLRLDLADAERVVADLRAAAEGFGRLDAVVVCAAISPIWPLETMPIGLARKTLEVNCLSAIAIYQGLIATLRESHGRFVFISSMSGKIGMPIIGAYVASKFGLEGAADVMRQEAQRSGVDVVVVEPGGIRTGMVHAQIADVEARIPRLSAEEAALYGDYYRNFKTLASNALTGASTPPEGIAAVVLQALTDTPPETRYIGGEDARHLIEMARTRPDREMDALWAEIFESASGLTGGP
jgi:NAD(P)-dependent dehydrogenase (short-subunit alcohol dehydrogenase family)